MESSNRLKGEDIPAWVPTFQVVERHVTGWFDARQGGKKRSDLQYLAKSMVAPSPWGSSFNQDSWNSFRQSSTTPYPIRLHAMSALALAKYGYNGLHFEEEDLECQGSA